MPSLETLNHLLIEFYDKLSSWEQSVVKGTGYSLAQIHTIEVLGNHGPLRMKELADRLGITTGTLTVQVDKLVRAELIERCPHPDDRRSIVVQLTPSGDALHRHHNQLHLALVEDLTRHVDQQERDVLIRCLGKINREF
ncbi:MULTISPECIES: MarR family winged helix-turn-helix transcriptional regulator [unclassified Vibrio]|uniref:MarR family winged helix-turn-helix transcriptional regulator n=1 Tax=unclassified Vibrio TaxID=2614977 RepID=UPI0013617D30|nr:MULTISPECIES: MarR family transcriptional regulator [unclassified Vibrio]NAW56013.1 MarR family transcriptional regulator [Vibrio sp. V36_P2S2PM302]NAX22439.1 MarR family transcriptional regulator [Vibrio sp. V39_P1S14PM300]NAX26592.1 MarR family transcriptional regulator [Vibrio sp. V38_P2S17PM301]NAX32638.1 MarR family transcriptional regulator [Vibrio sp. V37_P2S8PM304]